MTRNTKKIILYLILAFGLSWLLVGVYVAAGGRWGSRSALLVATAFMVTPLVATLIVHRLFFREPVLRPLGVSFKWSPWLLVAWLLPPALAVATFATSLLFPGVRYSPQMESFYDIYATGMSPATVETLRRQAAALPVHVLWLALPQALLAGATINALFAFGEEIGWRGLLQRELAPLGFWKSSLTIGLVWGIWHAPVILQGHNYPQHPRLGVPMMILFCILLSPLFSYVRLRARSVIAAAVAHGTLNATAGLPLLLLKGGSDLTIGVGGLSMFSALLLANLLMIVYDRCWSRSSLTRGPLDPSLFQPSKAAPDPKAAAAEPQ